LLTAGDIHTLAKSECVGLVLLDDRTVQLDLADSIAIARSVLPHTRGIDGTGVRVAVFERGPRDTTSLVFAERYNRNPTESDHARLVSAIVKNIEPNSPHGHAPNCQLYSANSYDRGALEWAVGHGCTVVTQSFHLINERRTSTLSSDDIWKDWLAINHPFPTIVPSTVNSKSPTWFTKDSTQFL